MKGSSLRYLSGIFVAFALFGCKPDIPTIVPYADTEARFPEKFNYLCPDYESWSWSCPFEGEPVDKVVFSGPLTLEPDLDASFPQFYNYDLLFDSLRLIDSVPPGEDLYATSYYFSASPWSTAIRDALTCAVERGVNVQVIIGNPISEDDDSLGQNSSTQYSVRNLLGLALESPNLAVHGCTGGCLQEDSTLDGKQHSKFFAASRICDGHGTVDNVVAVSSNNWTSSLVKRDNATVIKRDDAKLYKAFTRYFNDMVAAETLGLHMDNYYDSPDGEGGVLGTGFGVDRNYQYHLFPRAGGVDLVNEKLKSVHCIDDTTVRVAMSHWSTARASIVDTLADLSLQGCHVRIVVGDEASGARLRQYIVDKAATLGDADFQFRNLPSSSLHDKYFMIDGYMGDVPERHRFFWTGSHNYSSSSLNTNEETALSISDWDWDSDGEPDNLLYWDFLDHFEWQWTRAETSGDFLGELE